MRATGRESAVEVVDRLLRAARDAGASDLHLDPGEGGVAVRMRCDGVLAEVGREPAEIGARLVARLKALADLLAYRTDLPQEGRIAADRSGIGVELRVATYPTIRGERVALRLDAPGNAPRDLESLGLPDGVREDLARALEAPEGVVLLTGPSGSGKTTTLYSGLRHLTRLEPPRCIVTVEDPVEREIAGVVQTEVNRASGLGFAAALRSLLRQDPDVVLVGEIRDRETAEVALEAGLTGHLVASTIHAGTAPRVFARLAELGAEPFVVTTAVRGVLAQRLVRGIDAATGEYRGRILVAEWLPMSPGLRSAILDRADGETLEAAAREDGVPSLADAAAALVREGRTTEEEVKRVLGS